MFFGECHHESNRSRRCFIWSSLVQLRCLATLRALSKAFLPFVVTHHHAFGRGMRLASQYEAARDFMAVQSEILVHADFALDQLRAARAANSGLAGER